MLPRGMATSPYSAVSSASRTRNTTRRARSVALALASRIWLWSCKSPVVRPQPQKIPLPTKQFHRQHITKKHGHCFECNGMANITSIKTWAAKQSEHICEPADTTKTVPDGLTGRRRRTSAKEGRPEALLRTALEIWRKAGEMGLEKFKNSEEWHGVKRRVDAARTRHDDDEDREWVVWFAMLFARWDIIGNVNPRESDASELSWAFVKQSADHDTQVLASWYRPSLSTRTGTCIPARRRTCSQSVPLRRTGTPS